ncbi:MAG: hypothetical protein ABEH77_02255, partial [Halobacteriaceae archaeon]
MPCPHHDRGADDGEAGDDADAHADGPGSHGLDRRQFAKAALAIGGTSALSSLSGCASAADGLLGGSLGGSDTDASADAKTSPRLTAAARDNRQHAWDAFEHNAPTGNTVQPANSLFLWMNYEGEGTPDPRDRRRVELALRDIESTFGWGADGVLFTIAYTASYFDRFDEDPPEGARPMAGDEVAARAEEITNDQNIDTNDQDALLLMASENVQNLLAVEAALWGETVELETEEGTTEVSFEDTFEGIFTKPEEWPDRRTGAGGPALPTEKYNESVLDAEVEVPEEAPLSMGFVAGFDTSIPKEDNVTLLEDQQFPTPAVEDSEHRDPGVFAQGTLKHVSLVELQLNSWYGTTDLDDRRHRMYSPYHTREETGEVGKQLTKDGGGNPGADADAADADVPDLRARGDGDQRGYAERTVETAESGTALTDGTPTVAHSQKTARARYDLDGDGEPEQPVLRRDWDAIVGGDDPAYHFNVPMRFNEQIFSLLESMHSIEFESMDGEIDHEAPDSDEWRERNGLVNYTNATHRTNMLVPPITLRSLPYPTAIEVDLDVSLEEGTAVVRIPNGNRVTERGSIDPSTVRFGYYEMVNRAVGVSPEASRTEDGALVYEFPLDGTGLEQGQLRARFFAKLKETRRPVVGTAEVPVPTTEDS